MITLNEDRLFGLIIKGSSWLLLVLTISGWALFSAKTGLGVFAGGCIAIVNIFWIRNVLKRVLENLPAKASLYAQFRYVARLALTGVVLYFIVISGKFSLIGLFVGLSVIVVTIIALSLYCALRTGG